MKPYHFVSENERKHFEEFRQRVLQADWDDPPKRKWRCRIFGCKWFTHSLPPGSRTICYRCKINRAVFENAKQSRPETGPLRR